MSDASTTAVAAATRPEPPEPSYRLLTPRMRVWLWVDSVLVLLSGFQLFVLTEMTDRVFAWTIDSPITAAFLGAGYWASLYLVFFSSRQRYWSHARLAVSGVFVFTVLTTVATLMHLDKFHLSAAMPGARVAAWGWLIVYVIVPLALAALLAAQHRAPGVDPPRTAPLPSWLREVLVAQAAVMMVLGAVLFIRPTTPVWPWALTPLTGRAVAAWLIGIGVIAMLSAREDDWHRVSVAMGAYWLLGVLHVLVIVRYAGMLDWRATGTWAYLVFVLGVLGIGWYGRFAARLRGATGPLRYEAT